MSYQGYPQQPPGQWPGAGGYQQPYPERGGSPALAVLSGIFGLGIAGMLGYATIDLIIDVGEAPDLPGGWIAMFIINLGVAALGLLGAILVFARLVAGAFVLLAAGVLAVAAIVIAGAIANLLFVALLGAASEVRAGGYQGYWEAMFEFGNEQAVLFALTLFTGAILAVIAALPPSLRYLRGSRGHAGHQQGW